MWIKVPEGKVISYRDDAEAIMAKMGYTPSRFSQMCGLNRSTVRFYLGAGKVPQTHAETVMKKTGKPFDFFFCFRKADDKQDKNDLLQIVKQRCRIGTALAGMNSSDLCRGTGMTIKAISHIMNGYSEPRLFTIIKIADCLGVSLDWLCGRTDEIKNG